MPLWSMGDKAGLPHREVAERTGGVNNPNAVGLPMRTQARKGGLGWGMHTGQQPHRDTAAKRLT